MIILDTTILVYALGSDHPLREPCRKIIAAVGDGRIAATTTVEVVQEFAHVRARRRPRADAAVAAAHYATLLAPLLQIDGDDLADGLRLFRTNDRIGAFDAVLAAAAVRREYISAIVSADQGFSQIDDLLHLSPSDDDLPRQLGI